MAQHTRGHIIFCIVLFPLDGCRGLSGDIINHAIDSADLVGYSRRNAGEQRVRQSCVLAGHEVAGADRTNCNNIFVCAEIAHNSHAACVGHDRKVLIGTHAATSYFLANDRIGFAQDIELLLSHLAYDTYRKSGTREGLTPHELFGQSEKYTEAAYLILEQETERLDNALKAEIGRKSADIVVALDDRRLVLASRLNNIRDISTPCARNSGEPCFFASSSKVRANSGADHLALLLGVGNARELGYESVLCVNVNKIKIASLKCLTYLLGLALAHESVVNINANELTGYRARKAAPAQTDESTPPESPSSTLLLPTLFFTSLTLRLR